jgi:hypothetical protein
MSIGSAARETTKVHKTGTLLELQRISLPLSHKLEWPEADGEEMCPDQGQQRALVHTRHSIGASLHQTEIPRQSQAHRLTAAAGSENGKPFLFLPLPVPPETCPINLPSLPKMSSSHLNVHLSIFPNCPPPKKEWTKPALDNTWLLSYQNYLILW